MGGPAGAEGGEGGAGQGDFLDGHTTQGYKGPAPRRDVKHAEWQLPGGEGIMHNAADHTGTSSAEAVTLSHQSHWQVRQTGQHKRYSVIIHP